MTIVPQIFLVLFVLLPWGGGGGEINLDCVEYGFHPNLLIGGLRGGAGKTLRQSCNPVPPLHTYSHVLELFVLFTSSGHNQEKGRSGPTQAGLCKLSKIPGRPIGMQPVYTVPQAKLNQG